MYTSAERSPPEACGRGESGVSGGRGSGGGVASSARYSLVVHILAANDLVDDPVENVKNEEDKGESHAGHGVNPLGAGDEDLAHLLHCLLRWVGGGWSIVAVAFDGHAILGLQAGGAHAIGGKAETALPSLILLQHKPTCLRPRPLGHAHSGTPTNKPIKTA